MADPSFWAAWRITGLFTLFALVFGYVVPFLTSRSCSTRCGTRRAYFRLLVYLPVMMPPVAAAFLWQLVLPRRQQRPVQRGPARPAPADLAVAADRRPLAVLCLVIFSTWANMGGAVLIYLAALQGVPGELYEAAELDGAGILKRVWHVTVPQTRLILSLMLMLQIVSHHAGLPRAAASSPAASNDTSSVVYQIYQYAFNFNNYGDASALGIILLLVLMGFAAVYLKLARSRGGGLRPWPPSNPDLGTLISRAQLSRPAGKAAYWTVFGS